MDNISQLEPDFVQEIRRLAENAINIENGFDTVRRKFDSLRRLPGMQSTAIAIETDRLIDEWTGHKKAGWTHIPNFSLPTLSYGF